MVAENRCVKNRDVAISLKVVEKRREQMTKAEGNIYPSQSESTFTLKRSCLKMLTYHSYDTIALSK